MVDGKKVVLSGCIKTSRGPWRVHRATKDGRIFTKFRYPSDRERQTNQQRERRRRAVARKIFEGLRKHGNYKLPKHVDSNDLFRLSVRKQAGKLRRMAPFVGRFFTTLIMKLMLQAPMMPHQKISITAHVAINWIQNMVHFHRAPTLQFKSAMEEMMSTSPFHSSFQVHFEKEKTRN